MRPSQPLSILEASHGSLNRHPHPRGNAGIRYDIVQVALYHPDTHHIWMGALQQARSEEAFRKLDFLTLDSQDGSIALYSFCSKQDSCSLTFFWTTHPKGSIHSFSIVPELMLEEVKISTRFLLR
jgi:hypothetical protein